MARKRGTHPARSSAYVADWDRFDFKSIMIYSSGTFGQDSSSLVLVDHITNPKMIYEIYMGGHWDPDELSWSDWDIERVRQLYPITGEVPKRDTGHWAPVRFEMAGFATTAVRSAPSEKPTSVEQIFKDAGGVVPGQAWARPLTIEGNVTA